MDGQFILNFLNAREPFWYWQLTDIKIDQHYIEFKSLYENNQTTFHIEITRTGFVVKLYKPTMVRKRRLAKVFRQVNPIDLEDVISSVIFHNSCLMHSA